MGSAFADVWEHLVAAIPAGWTRRAPGAIGAATQVAIPTLNGVWVHGAEARREEVSSLLDRIRDEGVPYCLELTPRCDAGLRELAQSRLMRREQDIPVMTLEDTSKLSRASAGALTTRILALHEGMLHAEVAAAGFEAPLDVFSRIATPSVLGLPGVCAYLGELDGEAVATGIGVTMGQQVGIFNIATLPAQRRRGYGAAITVQAIRDGFAHGARWAWLQSSAAGYGVYEKLGFITLESWECWVSS